MHDTVFVVRLIEAESDAPSKRFTKRLDARDHARKMVENDDALSAEIWQVSANTAPELVEVLGNRATEADAQRSFHEAWAKALAEDDTATLLKLLGL
jgi:hypothetical protein